MFVNDFMIYVPFDLSPYRDKFPSLCRRIESSWTSNTKCSDYALQVAASSDYVTTKKKGVSYVKTIMIITFLMVVVPLIVVFFVLTRIFPHAIGTCFVMASLLVAPLIVLSSYCESKIEESVYGAALKDEDCKELLAKFDSSRCKNLEDKDIENLGKILDSEYATEEDKSTAEDIIRRIDAARRAYSLSAIAGGIDGSRKYKRATAALENELCGQIKELDRIYSVIVGRQNDVLLGEQAKKDREKALVAKAKADSDPLMKKVLAEPFIVAKAKSVEGVYENYPGVEDLGVGK